ncbi:ribbon-helix-helix domain-containing protein [Oculatella sp. LEGE 06141]|uniref:ribbon-helix-helix domain-containing protein n=1 Tax=Oculatella sp. LEGE 06141 TaxID=1828648 RepID=UPI0030DC0DEE
MTPKKYSSRFDALFGAAKDRSHSDVETSNHLDVSTSKHPKPAKSQDPDYQRTTIYLPKVLHRKLKAATAEGGREISEVVEELVRAWLESRHPDA